MKAKEFSISCTIKPTPVIIKPIKGVPSYKQTQDALRAKYISKRDPNYNPSFGRVMPTSKPVNLTPPESKAKAITCPNCGSGMKTELVDTDRWQTSCMHCGVAGPYRRNALSASEATIRILGYDPT